MFTIDDGEDKPRAVPKPTDYSKASVLNSCVPDVSLVIQNSKSPNIRKHIENKDCESYNAWKWKQLNEQPTFKQNRELDQYDWNDARGRAVTHDINYQKERNEYKHNMPLCGPRDSPAKAPKLPTQNFLEDSFDELPRPPLAVKPATPCDHQMQVYRPVIKSAISNEQPRLANYKCTTDSNLSLSPEKPSSIANESEADLKKSIKVLRQEVKAQNKQLSLLVAQVEKLLKTQEAACTNKSIQRVLKDSSTQVEYENKETKSVGTSFSKLTVQSVGIMTSFVTERRDYLTDGNLSGTKNAHDSSRVSVGLQVDEDARNEAFNSIGQKDCTDTQKGKKNEFEEWSPTNEVQLFEEQRQPPKFSPADNFENKNTLPKNNCTKYSERKLNTYEEGSFFPPSFRKEIFEGCTRNQMYENGHGSFFPPNFKRTVFRSKENDFPEEEHGSFFPPEFKRDIMRQNMKEVDGCKLKHESDRKLQRQKDQNVELCRNTRTNINEDDQRQYIRTRSHVRESDDDSDQCSYSPGSSKKLISRKDNVTSKNQTRQKSRKCCDGCCHETKQYHLQEERSHNKQAEDFETNIPALMQNNGHVYQQVERRRMDMNLITVDESIPDAYPIKQRIPTSVFDPVHMKAQNADMSNYISSSDIINNLARKYLKDEQLVEYQNKILQQRNLQNTDVTIFQVTNMSIGTKKSYDEYQLNDINRQEDEQRRLNMGFSGRQQNREHRRYHLSDREQTLQYSPRNYTQRKLYMEHSSVYSSPGFRK